MRVNYILGIGIVQNSIFGFYKIHQLFAFPHPMGTYIIDRSSESVVHLSDIVGLSLLCFSITKSEEEAMDAEYAIRSSSDRRFWIRLCRPPVEEDSLSKFSPEVRAAIILAEMGGTYSCRVLSEEFQLEVDFWSRNSDEQTPAMQMQVEVEQRGDDDANANADVADEAATAAAAAPPLEFLFKKILKQSDIDRLCRLAVPKKSVEKYIFPMCSPETRAAIHTEDGSEFLIWDSDSNRERRLVFKLWSSSNTYVFTTGWIDFVRERGLNPNDIVNFWWENILHAGRGRFCISVEKHIVHV